MLWPSPGALDDKVVDHISVAATAAATSIISSLRTMCVLLDRKTWSFHVGYLTARSRWSEG
jgi:hypothetical protein